MEILVQTYRLDAQEQQIKQLQGDVAKIKTSLKLLEEELVESREFRKVVLNWMHHQDSRSNFRSISQFPDSSSGSVSPPSSFSAQLEAFIARSEERLGKSLLHTGCGSKSRPESVNWALSTAENTFVHDRFEEASADHGHLLRNFNSDSCFSDGSADPLFRSPSLPSSPSLCIQLKNIMSRSGENPLGDGLLMSHRVNGLLDNLQGMLGSDPLVGHNGELKTVVDWDYLDPGQGVEQNKVVGLIFSDLDLCEKGNTPFDRGKSSLSHRPLIGMRLKFSATSHLWVVHGQPRPPEVVVGFQS